MLIRMIESGSFPTQTEAELTAKDDSAVTDNDAGVKQKRGEHINKVAANRRMSTVAYKSKATETDVKR